MTTSSASSDSDNKIMECPLTNIKVVTCPVKTCSYNTCHEKNNCLAHRNLLDDIEFHIEDIADAKGISVAEFKSHSNRGQKQIQRIMVLHGFLSWAQTKHWSTFPSVEGYRDPQLIQYVNNLSSSVSPFKLEILKWNMGLICVSVNTKWWEEYCDHKEIDFVSISLSLGVPRKMVTEIQGQFKSAHKRATSAKAATTGEK